MNNITLISLAKLALKHIVAIAVAAVVCAAAAFSYCTFIASPRYSATGSLISTNGMLTREFETSSGYEKGVSYTDINASIQITDTITDLLKTNGIYKDLAKKLGGNYKYGDIKSRSSVSRRNTDSLFIDVTFTASSPEEALKLVNGYLDIAPDYVLEYIPGSTVSVTTTADKSSRVYPRTSFTTLAAALIGAVVCFGVFFVVSVINNKVHTEDDIRDNFKIMLIGNVPDFESAKSGGKY